MKRIIPFVLLLLTLNACKKDDPVPADNGTSSADVPTYFPLAIGNYWVYNFQSYDPDGVPFGTTSVDSLQVVGDSLINDELYYQLETSKPVERTLFLREDNGYVVSAFGSIMTTPGPDSEVYNAHYNVISDDTMHFYFDQFPRTDLITTNFGNEECLAQESVHEMFPNFGGAVIIDTTYYASFGPVERSYSFAAGTTMKGVLTSYHLEE